MDFVTNESYSLTFSRRGIALPMASAVVMLEVVIPFIGSKGGWILGDGSFCEISVYI